MIFLGPDAFVSVIAGSDSVIDHFVPGNPSPGLVRTPTKMPAFSPLERDGNDRVAPLITRWKRTRRTFERDGNECVAL